MAQETTTVVVDLPTSGSVNATVVGFGTPTAAIVLASKANTTNNPANDAGLSIGFWDGTNQCVSGVASQDNLSGTKNARTSDSDDIIRLESTETLPWAWEASSTTNGITLTKIGSATVEACKAIVVLIKGVDAKILNNFTPNSSDSGTASSGSLGFTPKAIVASCIGDSGEVAAGSHNILSFGAATTDGTHRMFARGSSDTANPSNIGAVFSTNYLVSQTIWSGVSWGASITSWDTDTFTMTTSGSTGGDTCHLLVLGGADVDIEIGSFSSLTSVGSDTITTTHNPDNVLLCSTGLTAANTHTTDNKTAGWSIGIGDGANSQSVGIVEEDNASTTNCESLYDLTYAMRQQTSASGAVSDLYYASVTPGTGGFDLDYANVDGTARMGFWVSFGTAATGGGTTINLTSSSLSLSGNTLNVSLDKTISLDAGSLGFTGGTLRKIRKINLDPGDITLTGQDLSLDTILNLDNGILSLTGEDLNISTGLIINLDAGTITLSPAQLSQDIKLTLQPGDLKLSGDTLLINGKAIGRRVNKMFGFHFNLWS